MNSSAPAFSGLAIPDLRGKSVLITGASTGIGAALVLGFARVGSRVALHYNSSADAAEAVANEARKLGGEVFMVRGDFSKSADVRRVVAETVEHFGGLDGLINNAGGMVARQSYADWTDDHYDAVLDLNARSVVAATRAAIPYIKAARGFVINTTSIAARNGAGPGAGMYGSAKAFVSDVTRGMAKEWVKDGVRVNAVAPGVIATPFHERYSTDAQMAAMVATIPAGRTGTAEECVGAYLFLASQMLSGYVSGQVIEVNGGQLMP
jgi:3-oxoacyl-[acyl-carrier protein] reductase